MLAVKGFAPRYHSGRLALATLLYSPPVTNQLITTDYT
jgi:hypothetical protein